MRLVLLKKKNRHDRKSDSSKAIEIMNDRELSKGQKTALKILEAAARCVAKIGVEKTSITAIAQEA
ncbi:MAG: hypothetical protein AABY86_16500, partial [Bdellovibrionota bacterium]